MDISAEEGRRITDEACSWVGTPYALVGDGSLKGIKGDCSGSTNKIYAAAGFPYSYRTVATFEAYVISSGRFRKLSPSEIKQDGDILLWDSHMAIYSTFKSKLQSSSATTPRVNKKSGKGWTQVNDMWTASRTGGPPYGSGASKWWFEGAAPDVYRYVKNS